MSLKPPAFSEEVALIVRLLREATTLRVVSEFLKKKDLPHSVGSWQDLEEERIAPALETGKLTVADLRALLDEAEEYGRCHVFVFRCSPKDAADFLDEKNVKKIAARLGVSSAITNPLVTELPPAPTISSIRLDGDGSGTLSIKLVETRTYEELVEQKTEGNRKTYVYEQMQARAVNVMRLSSTGILELRIQSHLNRSQYHEDIKRVWSCMDDFFPEAKFSRHSLQKLKERIWKNRDTLEGKIRVSDVRLEDDKGFPITASTPKADSNLAGHAGAVNSIQAFLDAGAHQKSAGVWWVKQENGIPSTDIHILLSGESNEFALTATCTKADYEYVLAQFTRIGL